MAPPDGRITSTITRPTHPSSPSKAPTHHSIPRLWAISAQAAGQMMIHPIQKAATVMVR